MARLRTIELGVLNIKIQPIHKPEFYIELFKDLFSIADTVQIRGSDWGMPISYSFIQKEKPLDGIIGTFYKFMQINENDPWVDLRERKKILDKKGDPVSQVEKHKRPNTKDIEFIFYPKKHRFFFNTKSLSPNSAKRLLDALMQNEKIVQKYGFVDIEIESSKEVIENILKIPLLTSLEITMTRPNPDDFEDIDKEIQERFEKQNLRTYSENMKPVKGESIKPDSKTIAFMRLATSNGSVNAEGYDGDEKIEESTELHPLKKKFSYDPDKKSLVRAIYEFSLTLLSGLH